MTRASWARVLHRALLDIYDPGELAKSPLIELLNVGQQPDPPAALRRLLLEAIEGLKPPDSLPPQASAWRTYRILLHRYVQQIAQREIASSLGFSVRQLQRHEQVALQSLGDYLAARYELDAANAPAERRASAAAHAGAASQELERLRSSFASQAASLAEMVQGAIKTVAPLLEASGVRVESSVPERLPRVAVQAIPMRQALVSLLQVAARCVPGGHIAVHASAQAAQVRVLIRPRAVSSARRPLCPEDNENLEMARQLVALSGGRLDLVPEQDAETPFSAALALPAVQELGVLVIDDNTDALQLCRRYLEGSRYTFIGARDPQQALSLAQQLSPKIIVLDVMLPEMDGWEVLERLREHPATRSTPVIVCTILPHEQLALTLGAAAFLRKPLSRAALLQALDALADRFVRGGR